MKLASNFLPSGYRWRVPSRNVRGIAYSQYNAHSFAIHVDVLLHPHIIVIGVIVNDLKFTIRSLLPVLVFSAIVFMFSSLFVLPFRIMVLRALGSKVVDHSVPSRHVQDCKILS